MQAVRSIIALVAVFVLAACNPIERAGDARERVDIFHKQFNAGDDDTIWRGLAPEFREVTNRQEFDNLLATIRRTLGKVEETSQVGVNMNTNPNGSFTVLTMETTFENGPGQEVFTFVEQNDQLRIIGYNVNSKTMMDALMVQAAQADAGEPGPSEPPSSRIAQPAD